MNRRLAAFVLGTLLLRGAAAGEPYGFHAALNPVRFQDPPAGERIAFVSDGRACATVVVPDGMLKDKRAVETMAAEELVDHVKLATGAELPVVEAADAPDEGVLILLGDSTLARRHGLSTDAVAAEGFRIRTFDAGLLRGVLIAGPKPAAGGRDAAQGTLFGVYDWLERFVGVRWYYPGPDGRVVPTASELTMQPVHYTDRPFLLKRTLYVTLPGHAWRIMGRRYRSGNSSPVPWTACHTPGSWGIHFDKHPTTFELRADGTRHPNMPCYGNPETAEVYLADIARFYESGDTGVWTHPAANVDSAWFPPSASVIPISPPDKGVECRCEYCRPLYDVAADRHGRASRVVARHVALVAEGIQARWPGKLVWFLPYANYTVPPSDLTLPSNVVAGVCMMRGAANAKEPAIAQVHADWISGWKRATGRPVHLWEYLCWPADDTALPFQYPHVIQAFYRRHRDDIQGSFINGGYAPRGLAGGNYASFHPTIYCWMRLMWNPDFDVDAALDEYVRLMYGPAAGPMGRLIRLLTQRWEDTRWEATPADHHVSPRQIHEETMPPDETRQLAEWLAAAREAAGADTLYRRRVDYLGGAVDLFLVESREYHDQTGVATLPVLKVGDRPVIDGKLNEPCWGDAAAQPFVRARDPENPEPEAASSVQAVWTEQGIGLGFRFSEPSPAAMRAERTVHDQDVYSDDAVEIFLDPEGERAAYVQIVINSLGTVFDRHSQHGEEWNAAGIDRAASVGDDAWILEVFIPYTAFPEHAGGAPAIGDIWYGNFIRSRHAGGPWQLTRWSTRYRYSNLDFSAFGKLRFVE